LDVRACVLQYRHYNKRKRKRKRTRKKSVCGVKVYPYKVASRA
jgi:hypothetical protein